MAIEFIQEMKNALKRKPKRKYYLQTLICITFYCCDFRTKSEIKFQFGFQHTTYDCRVLTFFLYEESEVQIATFDKI